MVNYFPAQFFWGGATSSSQIEGGYAEAGRGLTIQDVVTGGDVYKRQSKTPVPEGCEDLTAECEGCKITSCAHNPVLKQSKGENKE